MKARKIALTIAACLLGLVGMAQNTVVEGTNLNIGEGNTLTGDAIGTRGHAMGYGCLGCLDGRERGTWRRR